MFGRNNKSNGQSGRVAGKVSLVTGSGKGLGEAQARTLAREGAIVWVSDLDARSGEAVTAALKDEGKDARFVRLDVTDEADWTRAVDKIVSECGRIDVVVNNAGVAIVGNVEECTLSDWRKTIAVNLDGVFLGTREAIKHMKSAGGGSIINICSIESIVGEPIVPAYNASKGGVRIFTKSAALHCAKSGYGIRINCVHPAFVMTDMVSGAAAALPDPQAFADEILRRHPMGRLCEPQDVANAVLFLASEDSSYINGSEIIVDGGYTAQ